MNNTKKIVTYALVIAIILLMSFTPLGYLKMPGIEISLLAIPVAVGAILLGPEAGAVFGGVFGITSFIQCFGMSPFGAALLGINPVFTLIVCLVPRVLMGYLCGLIFKVFRNNSDKPSAAAFCVSSLAAAALNTIFFVVFLVVCFGNTQFIQDMQGGQSLLVFLAGFVGINGLVEIAAALVAGGVISKAVYSALNR